ncbi:MAG: hypothetical protein HZY73_03465 [Micropruina sp.]|nr:MAG: hypothetical protein HZY73_03465 [Micropruina sp.]
MDDHPGQEDHPDPDVRPDSATLGALLRWTASGGTYRVLHLDDRRALVGLETCLGGEQVDRLDSADPGFIEWLRSHPDPT